MAKNLSNVKRRPEVAVSSSSSSSSSGFRFLGSIYALVSVVVMGVWVKQQLLPTHRYLPWHQTPHWIRLLTVYDKLAARYFFSSSSSNCESKMLATSFGQTQAIACGSVENPPVLFFHGVGQNLLIYGEWLMPAFRETHYSIAVDYPCDAGRSIPPDSDPTKCPQTEEEIADWVSQVLLKLGIASSNRKTSMVGFSYGAFVAFQTARHKPQLVDKLVLVAPGGIFEELAPAFLRRAFVMTLFRSNWSQNYFLQWLTNNPHFDLLQLPPDDAEQMVSSREVAATIVAVPGVSCSDAVLEQVLAQHEMFLGIGEQEVILKNVSVAVERARSAGAQVIKMYPNAAHMLMMQVGDSIMKDVAEFLKTREEE